MVAQKRLPALGWRPSAPCSVFGNRRLANADAEFETFAMDPGSAPVARLISRSSWRISSATRGLPARHRDSNRQNQRKPSRCHRTAVFGYTIAKAFTRAAQTDRGRRRRHPCRSRRAPFSRIEIGRADENVRGDYANVARPDGGLTASRGVLPASESRIFSAARSSIACRACHVAEPM
jgi:hypothetical protein